MTDILIIPDAHAHPDYDNDRFKRIGCHIRYNRPDVVVCMGDFYDLPSLNAHSTNLSVEARRLTSDIACGRDALSRLHKAAGKGMPDRRYITLGNHESYLERVAADCPKLEGVVEMSDLGFEDHGWHVTPFKEVLELEGWSFSHYFPSGRLGKAMGGANIAASMLRKLHVSCVQGHSHVKDMADDVDANGKRINAVVVGCVSHPDQIGDWNRNTHKMWWRGLVWLANTRDGDADITFINMDNIA